MSGSPNFLLKRICENVSSATGFFPFPTPPRTSVSSPRYFINTFSPSLSAFSFPLHSHSLPLPGVFLSAAFTPSWATTGPESLSLDLFPIHFCSLHSPPPHSEKPVSQRPGLPWFYTPSLLGFLPTPPCLSSNFLASFPFSLRHFFPTGTGAKWVARSRDDSAILFIAPSYHFRHKQFVFSQPYEKCCASLHSSLFS